MRKIILLGCILMCNIYFCLGQEKLLYSTNFTNWEALESSTEIVVTKQTDFSKENLAFKFFQVSIDPAGRTESRFDYTLVSDGWAIAQKVAGSYIETSPLKSITKVEFIHGATGSNRGYKLWKKNATDADWVLLSAAVANPAKGQKVSVMIDEKDVALKFTNINDAQNAYMFDLQIFGNYTSDGAQFAINAIVNIEGAGSIVKNPNSDLYDQGTEVSLTANKNFGFKFLKWIDTESAQDISTDNPLLIVVDTTKNLTAVFDSLHVYDFGLLIEGSSWGQVKLNPEPVNNKYELGQEVSIAIVPNEVTSFSYWEDNSTNAQRIITILGETNVTAFFDEIPFIVGWDFRDQAVRSSRQGDYFAGTENKGLISVYEPEGTPVNWLASTGFSPSLPHVRFWTLGPDFKTRRRYLKAQFSTKDFENIQVKSLITANFQSYSIVNLEYSLDDITYFPLSNIDITTFVSSGTWGALNAELPDTASNQEKVYIKWVGESSSPIINEGNDNDGTAFTNVFIYADKIITIDSIKPQLVATVPVNGSNTAGITGNIVLTFSEKVKLGSGDIVFNGNPVVPKFGSKTANIKYERLDYNATYTLTIPAGALTDLSGNAFEGHTLSFNTAQRSEAEKKLFDAVVAQDGSGDFLTITEAIGAAPANRINPWLIFVKKGKYAGHHDIPQNKPFIHIIGQHRDSVIISDNRLSGGDNAVHVSVGATMVVNATDCYFENLTLENSFGHEMQAGPQALALYATTDRFAMNKCVLRSYQDTYLTAYTAASDRQYIRNSTIQGAVDFIYGGGDVFFDECTIAVTRASGGYIVAPSHRDGTLWGYVFSNCTIDQAIVPKATVYFGRAWQNKPKTVFLNTTLKADVYPVGWFYKMGAIPEIFADYGTMDASGNPIDLSQRIDKYEYDVKNDSGAVINVVKGTSKKSLTDIEAAQYNYENVMLRSQSTWDPRSMTEAPNQVKNVLIKNSELSWDHSAYARLYIVYKNQEIIGFSTTNAFLDTSQYAEGVKFYVQAVSEFGALSEISEAAMLNTSIVLKVDKGLILFPNPADQNINIIHPNSRNALNYRIYDARGMLVISGRLNLDQIEVSVGNLTPGVYRFIGVENENLYSRSFIKM